MGGRRVRLHLVPRRRGRRAHRHGRRRRGPRRVRRRAASRCWRTGAASRTGARPPAPSDSRAPFGRATARTCATMGRGPPRRRTSEPRPPARRERPPGRLRRLRCLGPRRGGRQAHLLRPLRAAAPRPGVGGHRHLQRRAAARLQGHGPRLPGLRRDRAERPAGAHRHRAHALLDDRRHHVGERAADARRHGRPAPSPSATTATSPTPPSSSTSSPSATARQRRGELARGNTTDTALVTALLAGDPDHTLEATALEVLPRLRGAFCLVFMDEHTLYAARDPQGVRPLVLGRLERGWVVASETPGARHRRRLVRPRGRAGRAHRDRRRRPAQQRGSRRSTAPGCVFEYVYLARPDTSIAGRSVHAARVEMGRRLAVEHPVEADLVIPVPGVRHARGGRLRRGVRHPVRPGPDQERVRRPHVHPAVADAAPARHPAQAQPAARRDPRQAPRRRRRLDRARQHPARARPDAARGRRRRGARADQLAAGEVAVLLRHRLRVPRRAHRQRPGGRGDRARRSAPTRSATSRRRA